MAKESKATVLQHLFGENVFPSDGPALIAGPCSAESEEQVLLTAQGLIEVGVHVLRAGAWKPRTIPGGFEGYGEVALQWMVSAREKTGIRIGTEIGTAAQARLALDYALDFVWLGARTTTSPFAVEEIAQVLSGSRLPIFLKNPIAPDLSLWHGALIRLQNQGIRHIIPVLRGFRLGDQGMLRNAPLWYLMRQFRELHPSLPIFCDPSHIAGSANLLPEVIHEASLQDYDGLMIEVHPNPESALTDAQQQITPQHLPTLLKAWQRSAEGATPLYDFRQHLRVIDNELIRLIAEREQISEQIGQWKQENRVDIIQRNQKGQMDAARRNFALQHGANSEMVEEIFRIIHEDSVAIQKRITPPKSST